MRDISYRVALGGIVSALCLVSMFLAGIMPALYLVLPMIAGVLMMIIAVEVSISWALLTYIAVSLLSMLICADKEASLIFIMFFGHYPIIRFYLEKLRPKSFRFLVKMAVFNACIIMYYYITVFMFGISEMVEDMGELGKYGTILFLVISNFIFVMHDLNLGMFYSYYRKKLMPRFRRKR